MFLHPTDYGVIMQPIAPPSLKPICTTNSVGCIGNSLSHFKTFAILGLLIVTAPTVIAQTPPPTPTTTVVPKGHVATITSDPTPNKIVVNKITPADMTNYSVLKAAVKEDEDGKTSSDKAAKVSPAATTSTNAKETPVVNEKVIAPKPADDTKTKATP